MKHNNSISVRAGWRTEEERKEASREEGEDRGFTSVTAQGGEGVTQGSKVGGREAGEQGDGGEEECWSSLHSEWMSPVYTFNSVCQSCQKSSAFPEERWLHNAYTFFFNMVRSPKLQKQQTNKNKCFPVTYLQASYWRLGVCILHAVKQKEHTG